MRWVSQALRPRGLWPEICAASAAMLPPVESIPGVPLSQQAAAIADAQAWSGAADFEALLGAALAAEPTKTVATAAVPAEAGAAGLLLSSAPTDPPADRVRVDLQPSPAGLHDVVDAFSERMPVAPHTDWPVPRLGHATLQVLPLRPPFSTPLEEQAASSLSASEGAPPPHELPPRPPSAETNRPTRLSAGLSPAIETETSQDGEVMLETFSTRPATSSERTPELERGLPPSDAQQPTEASRSPAAPAANADPAQVAAAQVPSPTAAAGVGRFFPSRETSDRLLGLLRSSSEALQGTRPVTPLGGASVAEAEPDHFAPDPATGVLGGQGASERGGDGNDEPPPPPASRADEAIVALGAKSSGGSDLASGTVSQAAGLNVALPAAAHGALNSLAPATAALFPAPTDPSVSTPLQPVRVPDRPVIPPALQLAPIVITLSTLEQDAAMRLTLTLEPEELGRIEVAVERTGEARLAITMVADRPETLHLLQRDSALLDRALAQAGVGLEGRSLAFAFGGSGGRGDERRGRPNSRDEPVRDAVAEAAQPTSVRTLLDLAV